jgi:antitoxin HicB
MLFPVPNLSSVAEATFDHRGTPPSFAQIPYFFRGFRAGKKQQEKASKGTEMKVRKHHRVRDHSGSTFDSFLEEEGIREEVEAVAIERVLAWQISQAMQEQQKTKQAMAKQLHTSRSQLDRLLDPQNVSVPLDTITRVARALGKRIIIRVAEVKAKRA